MTPRTPDMTDEQLERVAREATPGPWVAKPDFSVRSLEPGHWAVATADACRRREANARFIATFGPDRVLSLLSRLQAAEAALLAIADDNGWFGEMRFAEDTDADFLLRVIRAAKARARQALSPIASEGV